MAMKTYPPGGRLFKNNRRNNERAPNLTGTLEIDDETMDHLVECRRLGHKLIMDLSAWRKVMNKDGSSFYSLSARPPWNSRKGTMQRSSIDDDLEDLDGYPTNNREIDDDEIPF